MENKKKTGERPLQGTEDTDSSGSAGATKVYAGIYEGISICRYDENGREIFARDEVWKKHNGEISPGFTVSHKNGNVLDCRLENLFLIPDQTPRPISDSELLHIVIDAVTMSGHFLEASVDSWVSDYAGPEEAALIIGALKQKMDECGVTSDYEQGDYLKIQHIDPPSDGRAP